MSLQLRQLRQVVDGLHAQRKLIERKVAAASTANSSAEVEQLKKVHLDLDLRALS